MRKFRNFPLIHLDSAKLLKGNAGKNSAVMLIKINTGFLEFPHSRVSVIWDILRHAGYKAMHKV